MQQKIKFILIFAAAFFIIQPSVSDVEASFWDKFKSVASKAKSFASRAAHKAGGFIKKGAGKIKHFAGRMAHKVGHFASKAAGHVRNFASKYGAQAMHAASQFHNSPLGQMVEQQAMSYGMKKLGVSAGMQQNLQAVASMASGMNQQAEDDGEESEDGSGPGDVYQSAMDQHHQAHESLHQAQEYQQAAQDAYDAGDQDSAQQYMQMHQQHMRNYQDKMDQYDQHQQQFQERFPNQQWPGHEVGYGPGEREPKSPGEQGDGYDQSGGGRGYN